MRVFLVLLMVAVASPALAQTPGDRCAHLFPKPHMTWAENSAAWEAVHYCRKIVIDEANARLNGMPIVVAPDPAPPTSRIVPQPNGTALIVPNTPLYEYNPGTGYYWSPGLTCSGGNCR